jgi:hypothetical protein
VNYDKLPFVVQPKREAIEELIGTEESGIISIKRMGYLTTGEKSFVQQAISGDDGTLRIIGLARKVSIDEGVSLDEGYSKVVSIISGISNDESKRIESKYLSDFTELLNALSVLQSKEKLIYALCLLRYRVNSEISVDDVMGLHSDIIDGLAELYREEESNSITKFKSKEGEEEVVDVYAIEKKPSKRAKVSE